MFGQDLPVSALLRHGAGVDEDMGDKRRNRDEFRKQRDLEEQRKEGKAPAMVDVETGRGM